MKNYKSLVKFMAFGAAATLLLTSCSMEDNMNKHFNDIDSNISNVIVKVDANESALEEQNEILSDIIVKIDAIGRQPEFSETIISFEMYTIEKN